MRSAHDAAPGGACGARVLGDASPPVPGVLKSSSWLPEELAANKVANAASVAAYAAHAAAILAVLWRWASAAQRLRRPAIFRAVGDAGTVVFAGGSQGWRASPSCHRVPGHTSPAAGGEAAAASSTPRWGGTAAPRYPKMRRGSLPGQSRCTSSWMHRSASKAASVRPGMSEKGLPPLQEPSAPLGASQLEMYRYGAGPTPPSLGAPPRQRHGDCGLGMAASPRAGAQ